MPCPHYGMKSMQTYKPWPEQDIQVEELVATIAKFAKGFHGDLPEHYLVEMQEVAGASVRAFLRDLADQTLMGLHNWVRQPTACLALAHTDTAAPCNHIVIGEELPNWWPYAISDLLHMLQAVIALEADKSYGGLLFWFQAEGDDQYLPVMICASISLETPGVYVLSREQGWVKLPSGQHALDYFTEVRDKTGCEERIARDLYRIRDFSVRTHGEGGGLELLENVRCVQGGVGRRYYRPETPFGAGRPK
jgi:hypothetical protein